jgi:hypothetical protein
VSLLLHAIFGAALKLCLDVARFAWFGPSADGIFVILSSSYCKWCCSKIWAENPLKVNEWASKAQR